MMGVSADPTLVSNSVVKDSFELSLGEASTCSMIKTCTTNLLCRNALWLLVR